VATKNPLRRTKNRVAPSRITKVIASNSCSTANSVSRERILVNKQANMSFNGWWDAAIAAIPESLPAMIGALLSVLVGFGTGKLFSVVGRALSQRVLDRLSTGPALTSALETSGVREIAPRLIGLFFF
jgi:hypothetical protein